MSTSNGSVIDKKLYSIVYRAGDKLKSEIL